MTIKIVKQPPAGVVFHLEGRPDAGASPADAAQMNLRFAIKETEKRKYPR